MPQPVSVPSMCKPDSTKVVALTFAIIGATLLSLSVSNAASAFTVGQTSTSNGNFSSARGQSFTLSDIGPNGSGPAPTSGTALLNSIKFAFQNAGNLTATTVYLYNILPTLANLNTGTGALAVSSGFSDTVSDSTFSGARSRTFSFSGVSLDVSTQYFALFSQDQTLLTGFPNPYISGFLWSNNGTNNLGASFADVAFVADATPTAVPFGFTPLPGLAAAWGVRAVRRKLQTKKQLSKVTG